MLPQRQRGRVRCGAPGRDNITVIINTADSLSVAAG